jgi:hypothetical protein
MGRAVRRLQPVETADEAAVAHEAGQRALATGDREALSPGPLRALVEDLGRENRLGAEIGALRAVAERLLAEVPDAGRLATLLPPVINAIVRALQAQRSLGGGDDDELARMVKRVLERANARRGGEKTQRVEQESRRTGEQETAPTEATAL